MTAAFPDSWYAATAHRAPDDPPLAGDTRCDVVVIGGGYTGLSAALTLAERGRDVILVEARRVGWGASGRNGGQMARGFAKPVATLKRMVGEADARALWALSEEARALVATRVARHDIDCALTPGHLAVANKPGHLADLEEQAEELTGLGVQGLRLLDRSAVRAEVQSDRYQGGLFDPGAGHLHPLNYALGLARAARTAGVRIQGGTRARRLVPGRRVRVETDRGTVEADHAILAGNAYLPDLGGPVGPVMRARVMPVGTFILATEPLGETRARALIPSGACVEDLLFVLNYYRVSPDHRLLFGGRVAYNPSTREPRAQARLQGTMLRYFPQLRDVGVSHFWGGDVAITLNRLPHFGRLADGVFFAQGFSGQGVALGGLAGTLMAEAVMGTSERFDVFARIPHQPFPGGRMLRAPALLLATSWYRLRDLLP